MATLIRGTTIVAMDETHGSRPERRPQSLGLLRKWQLRRNRHRQWRDNGRGGKLSRVDAATLLDELRDIMPRIMAEHEQLEKRNRPSIPLLTEVWWRCAEAYIGISRWSTDSVPHWRNNS